MTRTRSREYWVKEYRKRFGINGPLTIRDQECIDELSKHINGLGAKDYETIHLSQKGLSRDWQKTFLEHDTPSITDLRRIANHQAEKIFEKYLKIHGETLFEIGKNIEIRRELAYRMNKEYKASGLFCSKLMKVSLRGFLNMVKKYEEKNHLKT